MLTTIVLSLALIGASGPGSGPVLARLDSAVVTAGEVSVLIVQGPFDAKAHRIKRNADGDVTHIDGRAPYGCDGEVPWKELRGFTVLHRGAAYSVPKSMWSDCYNMNSSGLKRKRFVAKALPKNGGIVIRVEASDGAGGYIVEWTLRLDGKPSTRRFFDIP
ncbi:MAG: hypothetical protein KIS66_06935 [Fimbriimonadaceae bacterium]|nr:hypothetical protein [Fimbriimonadaceae bacterium]